jgi:uncharacterized phiE125 gp8 family phage protein
MRVELKTAPAVDAIALATIKTIAFANTDKMDDLIDQLIPSAVAYVENYTGRKLINQSWYIYADADEIKYKMDLWTFNIQSITEVLSYDTDDASSVVATTDYRKSGDNIIFKTAWQVPTVRDYDSFRFEVVTGYGAAEANIPQDIINAIAQIVFYWCQTGKTTASKDGYKPIPLGTQEKLMKYQKRVNWM